jgi:hypothetical protein
VFRKTREGKRERACEALGLRRSTVFSREAAQGRRRARNAANVHCAYMGRRCPMCILYIDRHTGEEVSNVHCVG